MKKEQKMITRKKAAGVAVIAALIPILLFSIFAGYLYQAVTKMGEEQIAGRTENYEKLKDAAPKHATVFFGDSITELCPLIDIYAPYVLESGVQVVNRGISAEKTDTMLKRLDDVLSLEPRNLVMLMGINDYYADVPTEEIIKNIQQMIDIIKTKQPQTHIIVQALYPVNNHMRTTVLEKAQSNGDDNANITKMNEAIKALAEKEGVTFLDVTPSLKDEEGNMDSAYTFDGLHPNALGYLAVRDQIIAQLK